jgi:hypothetical protein
MINNLPSDYFKLWKKYGKRHENGMRIDDIEKAILKAGRGKQKSSQDFNKMWNYVLELIKSEEFKKEIKNIGTGLAKKISIRIDGRDSALSFIPDALYLCKKYNLHVFWSEFLTEYILTGKINKPSDELKEMGLCDVVCINELGMVMSDQGNMFDFNNFPIAIRISPYTTQRDLIDFIKKNFKTQIEPIKKLFTNKKSRVGKIRSKDENLEKAKEYILNNQNKTRQKLSKEIKEKFGITKQYYEISILLNQEKKKRKLSVHT